MISPKTDSSYKEEEESAKAAYKEVERIKDVLVESFAAREDGEGEGEKEGIVFFEIFAGTSDFVTGNTSSVARQQQQQLQHVHWQAVPVPALVWQRVEEVLMDEAGKEGLEVVEELPEDGSMPYVVFEFPVVGEEGTGRKKVVLVPGEEKIKRVREELLAREEAEGGAEGQGRRRGIVRVLNLQFGRLVLANLLNKPERVDWKRCVVSEEEETKLTENVRKVVKL
ncbi:hypothetical protein HK102_001811 [Quaeritorhiza haematococci]|nr:hypothetical protein HK102_001811 [Quaeritorhiza haematococci]